MGRIGCLETVGTCSVSLIWQGKGQVRGHGRFLRILRAKNGSIPKLRNGNILILSGTRLGWYFVALVVMLQEPKAVESISRTRRNTP